METKDYMNVYSTDDISGDAVVSTGNPNKIIDGRVSVHSILYIPTSSTEVNYTSTTDACNNRCYFLTGSDSASDIYIKFGAVGEVTSSTSFSGQARSIQVLTGGDGMLFENGVYLGKDDKAPNGSTDATDYMLTLTIFYTGGANT
tara:strand:+ start:167 stop:601 length:435 start_codon:yes stop_codon:yes gene_type:complete